MWSYAAMSQAAKVAGGPEVWIASVKRAAELRGMIKGAVGGFGAGVLGAGLILLGINKLHDRKEEAENGEKKLIDAFHDGEDTRAVKTDRSSESMKTEA